MGYALFIAESFGGWDGDGVASGQHAGEKRAKSEERGGCEQTACGKGVLHPVGENSAEKAIQCKTDDNARGRADERDTRGDPQDVRARRAERQADAKLRGALRDTHPMESGAHIDRNTQPSEKVGIKAIESSLKGGLQRAPPRQLRGISSAPVRLDTFFTP